MYIHIRETSSDFNQHEDTLISIEKNYVVHLNIHIIINVYINKTLLL